MNPLLKRVLGESLSTPDDNNDMEFNPSTVFETTVPVKDPNLVFVPFVNKRHCGNKMKRVSGPNGYLMVPR